MCRAVREAVGEDMVLMLDPFGGYTLEEARWVGRELEKLNFYWLEHPMIETRVEAYRRLTSDLDIAICSPEHVPGGLQSGGVGAARGRGPATHRRLLRRHHRLLEADQRLQAFGLQCEMHTGGRANAQLLAATAAATCQYYEWGLLPPAATIRNCSPRRRRHQPGAAGCRGQRAVAAGAGAGIRGRLGLYRRAPRAAVGPPGGAVGGAPAHGGRPFRQRPGAPMPSTARQDGA